MMKIFNSFTNKLETFNTINKNEVLMYVCGPTVYNYIHIGNARPAITFDTFKRFFEFDGYSVRYVSNFTDIDDKIIKQAKLENSSEKEVSEKFIEAYLSDLKSLNCDINFIKPKVSENIDVILKYISELIDKDFAYVSEGDVYFCVEKLKEYGCLSNQNIEMLESGSRVDSNNLKRNQLDFTLWKKTSVGLNFNSKFGDGRPGWHTECVAMIKDIFGSKIDIHGGGLDLKFPHHENEIAQSMCCDGHNVANYWMHNGRIDVNNEKMSKSLGNVILVKNLENFAAFRFYTLSKHYRSPIKYSKESFDSSVKEFDKVRKILMKTNLLITLNNLELKNEKSDYLPKFKELMYNDFNTPNVITLIFEMTKEINKILRTSNLDGLKNIFNDILIIFEVLGIKLNLKKITVQDLIDYKKWGELKQEKNYKEADILFNTLIENEVL